MAKLPIREHRRRFALIAVSTGIALLAIAFLIVYFVIFPTSSPKPFKLSITSKARTASHTGARIGAAATGDAGSWSVVSGSQAGYRVREKLAFLPAQSDAVGRTSQITGSAMLTRANGSLRISAATFAVAVDTLKSDRSMRDEKIHEIGLESSRYPTATFALLKPLALPRSISREQVVRAAVTGIFDIHGVSKQETVPVEFDLSGSTLQAAGSLTFPWGEFGMTAPSVGGFVTVTGKATMEFDLRLRRV